MHEDAKPIRTVLNQKTVKDTRIGYCPRCLSAMSMRSFPISRCVVCGNLVNWDIETNKS